MQSSEHPDVIVVGAGIIGLMSAWELSNAGYSVTLIDKGQPGREASWAGGGILSPLGPWHYPEAVQKMCHESQALYPRLCEELRELTGIDPEWVQSGMLVLGDSQELADAEDWCATNQQPCLRMDQAAIKSDIPSLQTELQAVLMPEIAQVRNPRLLRALVTALEQSGVKLIANEQVRAIETEEGAVTGVRTTSEFIQCKCVVNSAGSWSPELIPRGYERPSVYPVKGQMLLFKAEPSLLNHIVLKGEQYLIPRNDGAILAGSSHEDDGYNKSPTVEVKAVIREFAEQLLPALADLPVAAHWTGLRPATSDSMPIIGAHGQISGLYMNTGHYRNGLTLAPASARQLLAEIQLNP